MPALHRAALNPYDHRHRARRAALIRAALGTNCPGVLMPDGTIHRSPHCIGVMLNPRRMHLDHSVPVVLGGRSGDRIVCEPCNLSAGATLGNRLRAARRTQHARCLPRW